MNGNASGRSSKDRVAFALGFLMGQTVEVTKTDGSVVKGVLVGAKNDPGDAGSTLEGVTLQYAGTKGESAGPTSATPVNIMWKDIESIFAADAGGMVKAVKRETQHEKDQGSGGFRTDTDISSGARASGAERKLQSAAWLASPPVSGGNADSLKGASLESGGPAGSWDQFKVNEEKFGVKSTYNENLYTTELDKGKISESERRRANRLARSIESQSSSNFHVREERGLAPSGEEDLDEESRYSSVTRNENAYQPPHRRGTPEASGKAQGDATPKAAVAAAQAAPEAPKASTGGAMSWAARVRGSQTQDAKEDPAAANTSAKDAPGTEDTEAETAKAAKATKTETAKGGKKESAKTAAAKPEAAKVKAAKPDSAKADTAKASPSAAEEKRMSDRQREIDGLKQFSETLKTKKSGTSSGGEAGADKQKKQTEASKAAGGEKTSKEEVKKGLNSAAKEWRPNANAKEFTPSQPAQTMADGGYGGPQGAQGGMPYGMPQGGYMPMNPGYGYPPQMMYPGMPMGAPGMYPGHYGQPQMGYYSGGAPPMSYAPGQGGSGAQQQQQQHQQQQQQPQQQ